MFLKLGRISLDFKTAVLDTNVYILHRSFFLGVQILQVDLTIGGLPKANIKLMAEFGLQFGNC